MFTDPALSRHAGRFVWLAIDGEQAVNAPLRGKLNIAAYPTFFVLDPVTERVALRWVGSFGVDQMPHILDAGETAVRGGGRPLDQSLVRADSLYAAGAYAAATDAYAAVLAGAPAGWAQRRRTIESLLFAQSQAGRDADCATLAAAELAALGHGAAAAPVAAAGLDCALGLGASDPSRAGRIAGFESTLATLVADESLPIAADDRSGCYIALLSARQDAGDSTAARRVAEAWSSFLDRSAAAAGSPAERVVFDSHRLSAYVELGTPERAIPMLEQSQRDFPDDYNPTARLAIAYNAMKRWDEAIAASDRALAACQGPRRLTLYRTRADIHAGMGDDAGAKRTLDEAIAYARALPPGQRSDATIASLEKRRSALP